MSVEHVGYQDVTIIAAQATRTGPPGMLTLRYALSAVPLSWERHFHEAYTVTFLTFRPLATFKDIDGNQIVMTIGEAAATEQTLATVRRNLDQAIAMANHKTRSDLAAYQLGAQAREAQAERDEDRLSEIQAILDKQ